MSSVTDHGTLNLINNEQFGNLFVDRFAVRLLGGNRAKRRVFACPVLPRSRCPTCPAEVPTAPDVFLIPPRRHPTARSHVDVAPLSVQP